MIRVPRRPWQSRSSTESAPVMSNQADDSPVVQIGRPGTGPMLVEIISEGPHCVPCDYCIAAVEYVSEFYEGRIDVKVVETKKLSDAARYLELCQAHGGPLPMPAILFSSRLVFDEIPGPEELCRVLDEALLHWETGT